MKEIIFAGFGGQGVLTGGLIVAFMAAGKDLDTVWLPSYGPTMRGGKAARLWRTPTYSLP